MSLQQILLPADLEEIWALTLTMQQRDRAAPKQSATLGLESLILDACG